MTAIDHTLTEQEPITAPRAARRAEPPLRCAIAGAGKMGLHHARALRRLGDAAVHVVGVADPMPRSCASMRQICAEAEAFSSLEELLARTEVDTVHVCTSLESHERLARLALESGCHVYIEKPVAASAAAAERLTSLAAEQGLILCAGHQLLFESPMRRTLELLPSLGSVVHAESFFSFRPIRRSMGGRPALGAKEQLLDVLPHAVYPLLDLLEKLEPDESLELRALEVGHAGTIHAIVRRGSTCGTLVVTLEGRPVESCLRVVGSNGMVHADFVRSTVQRLVGPGVSGIDKALNPFRLARQLLVGTSSSLAGRVAKRQRSYPGLAEIFQAFHTSILEGQPSPVSGESIVDTVRICEEIGSALERCGPTPPVIRPSTETPGVLVTGANGFLGRPLVEALAIGGAPVRAVARRAPAPWEREPSVEYAMGDLAGALPQSLFDGIDVVVHCAAETAGGRDEHQRNSIDATERVLRAAAEAGVRRFVHVSSLATLAQQDGRPIHDDDPLVSQSAELGPYVWGKTESERLARELGPQLGVSVRVVRPGALIDYGRFDPPGKLGRRIGNIFVAVGSPREQMGVVDLYFAGRTIAWVATHFDEAPTCLNLLAPTLPTRRELVTALRRGNPDLRVVWLPQPVLASLSALGIVLQKCLRRGRPAMNVAKIFASQRYDTDRICSLAPTILEAVAEPATERRLEIVT